ncbi:MAG: hypothetical protein K0R50_1249 [Eubacterium sp.]|nr:hypothetical protein [Eubacterium sp.]
MSGIPSAREFLGYASAGEEASSFKLGMVTELFSNGTAKIKFDGEDTASGKQYAYLAGYKPVINDRVLLAVVSGTYIILDKINYNVSPGETTGPTAGEFTTLHATGNTTLDGSLKVVGSLVFYNATPVGKQSVTAPSSMVTGETADNTYGELEQRMLNHLKADMQDIYNSVNSIVTALKQYNLG